MALSRTWTRVISVQRLSKKKKIETDKSIKVFRQPF
jgi:hypothetical protein